MRFALGILVVLLNVADNVTTFLCLRAPVAGFELSEANPAASLAVRHAWGSAPA